ncbi:cytochrome-b5 reductase KNAG_0J00140 [Huiozyma naganishii CBS 8797]|uniref:NADH-cytochrome b5 reductase n=1 Tax=Huiozyma naganishii (strain ATCC MYA-139 / BCRC 22969 / CBS 8797 / KCTC 17520 / NBRC 10181 / NCYC 3082 / Yp74L-3) TaxID=1071383 RepID=J7S2L5_HUIN7|nr:hypothetical protein KNAG_0J00140 [Kazachstania naganishii CBS 8797]CCK72097.1 hypothetical protein KNAG_0J00140 [Kazachstania naganishii CBS 8797]
MSRSVNERKVYTVTLVIFLFTVLPMVWIFLEEYNRMVMGVAFVALVACAWFLYQNGTPSLTPDEWTPLEFEKKKKISQNTCMYKFKLRNPREKLNVPVGYHVSVKCIINGKEEIRHYSPVSHDAKGYIELIVKTYHTGHVSEYFSELKAGDKVLFRGPTGEYQYREQEKEMTQLGLVAGGSGITPMLQVLNEIVSKPLELSRVSLLYANETEDDILMKSELDQMVAKYPHFEVHYVLHHAPKDWEGSTGLITKNQMEKFLPSFAEDHRLLICGPQNMTEIVLGFARELGWSSGIQKSKGDSKVFVF